MLAVVNVCQKKEPVLPAPVARKYQASKGDCMILSTFISVIAANDLH